jgi:hypothetical protein
MKLVFSIIIALTISGCGANVQKTQQKSNVIVADGTEIKQLENLMFCGNLQAFSSATGAVSSKLSTAWKEIAGQNSEDECTIRIKVDHSGNIVNHTVVACKNSDILPKVLEKATPVPVPVPKNACLFESINQVSYGLNAKKKGS